MQITIIAVQAEAIKNYHSALNRMWPPLWLMAMIDEMSPKESVVRNNMPYTPTHFKLETISVTQFLRFDPTSEQINQEVS